MSSITESAKKQKAEMMEKTATYRVMDILDRKDRALHKIKKLEEEIAEYDVELREADKSPEKYKTKLYEADMDTPEGYSQCDGRTTCVNSPCSSIIGGSHSHGFYVNG